MSSVILVSFVCILGGKGTGKSYVIYLLLDEHSDAMFVVNMRSCGGKFFEGLQSQLQCDSVLTRLLQHLTEFSHFRSVEENTEEVVEFGKVIEACKECLTFRSLIEELSKNYSDNMTLVIDDADYAFTITEDTTAKEVKEMKDNLALFSALTKDSRMVRNNLTFLQLISIHVLYLKISHIHACISSLLSA